MWLIWSPYGAMRHIGTHLNQDTSTHMCEHSCRSADVWLTDGVWTDRLRQTGPDCTVSVTRGIGPPKQCAVYDGGFAAVMALDLDPAALVSGGPVEPENLIVIGSFFLQREIESSLIWCKSAIVDTAAEKVWLHLASSQN